MAFAHALVFFHANVLIQVMCEFPLIVEWMLFTGLSPAAVFFCDVASAAVPVLAAFSEAGICRSGSATETCSWMVCRSLLSSGCSLAVRSGQRLRGFICLEAQIALLVLVGIQFVAQARVAEHQIVVCLQIFRIDRKRLLEFFHRIGIAFLQKKHAAQFVVDHAIARVLRQYRLESLAASSYLPSSFSTRA